MKNQKDEKTGIIWWIRKDLRLKDNPALNACIESGDAVLPVYIASPQDAETWPDGGASKVWLDGSLSALDESFRSAGSRLIFRLGAVQESLIALAEEAGAREIHANARYEPWAMQQEQALKTALATQGIELITHASYLLFEPDDIRNGSGKPYQVFTPYYKKCKSIFQHNNEHAALLSQLAMPAKKKMALKAPAHWPDSVSREDLKLLPSITWDQSIRDAWKPGEQMAEQRLNRFIEDVIQNYETSRNIPAVDGTSRLSPHLHFGEITPRQILARLQALPAQQSEPYIREIIWREFAYHVLYHFPHTTTEPLKPKFKELGWQDHPEYFERWTKGMTGYPIVDAGLRQLWKTGWMHNRVRMIVGSFLTKDLMISWQTGAAWFWDTLIDADLANNTLNWQWIAGCGADAQPFFRVFNPTLQGEKFDPDGRYIRQWIPELSALPDRYIHTPWKTPKDVLSRARVQLGETYPFPVVDHDEAKTLALKAYRDLKPEPSVVS